MAWRTERDQAVEIEVRAPLGALDDVVDLEGAPAPTGLAPPAGAPEYHPADRCPLFRDLSPSVPYPWLCFAESPGLPPSAMPTNARDADPE
jgi:hypothetical protein